MRCMIWKYLSPIYLFFLLLLLLLVYYLRNLYLRVLWWLSRLRIQCYCCGASLAKKRNHHLIQGHEDLPLCFLLRIFFFFWPSAIYYWGKVLCRNTNTKRTHFLIYPTVAVVFSVWYKMQVTATQHKYVRHLICRVIDPAWFFSSVFSSCTWLVGFFFCFFFF